MCERIQCLTSISFVQKWSVVHISVAAVVTQAYVLGGVDARTNDGVVSGLMRKKWSNSWNLKLKEILMHLRMQRDVWLDNVKNLQRYILRYTVWNPTSSCYVASHWLAFGFTQLTALVALCK